MDRLADLMGPTPYTGEDPQNASDNAQLRRDYTSEPEREAELYHWASSPTHVAVGRSPEEAAFQLNLSEDRPYAVGALHLLNNYEASWQIDRSSFSVAAIEKRLKRYTSDQGWSWQGLSDAQGAPINNPKEATVRLADVPGIGEINPGVKDWRINEWSGTDMGDNPGHEMSEAPYYGLQDYDEDVPMTNPRTCSECGQLCLDYDDWRQHVLREHVNKEEPAQGGGVWPNSPDDVHGPSPDPQAVVDLDDVLPAGFNEAIMDRVVQRQSRLAFQLGAAGQKPTIPAPMPFIYDIEGDRIYVGHPGERHSDIQGRFTPGGIVEGLYDPKGSVQIRTDTDMPYTVRHMAQLWYAMHPELEIKSIYLLVGQERYKLASTNIGHKVRNLLPSDPAAYAAYHALKQYGEVYAVGGVVRDVVLGKVPKDIDLMVVGAEPDLVQEALSHLPGRVDLTGKQFGVFRYRDPDGNETEIALPRTERSTGPGHKDFEVYTDPYIGVEEDLGRRDFTGNAMAVNLTTGELTDPYFGAEDLRMGDLRTVSDRSFVEDPLRILRALVSVSRHGLMPDERTEEQMAAEAPSLRELPAERIQAELDKVMAGPDPVAAFELAQRTGVLAEILPEVADTHGFDQQNKWHSLPLFEHLMTVLGHAVTKTDDPDVRWAALLHDIGKPASQWVDDDGFAHYYQNDQGQGQDHELVGSSMAKDVLRRLKFPNERVDRVGNLIRWHMYPPFEGLPGARRFVNRVGDDAEDLLTLRWADSGGKDKGNPQDGSVSRMRQLVQEVRDKNQPTATSQLAINGNDLIAAGFPPGPQMGQLLKWLTEQVLENPDINTKEQLLPLAMSWNPDIRTSNILDPIQDTLDPDVFENPQSFGPRVKPRIERWVVKKVEAALREAGWPDPKELDYLDVIFTGSLTTYQWGADSDFDVSVWIKTEAMPEWVRADLIGIMIKACDGVTVPGTTHPLQCFVVDTRRFTKDDLYKPGVRSAYDLKARRWIVYPERARSRDVFKEYPAVIAYGREVVDKIKMMLRYGNDDALRIYWNFIHHQRQRDMQKGRGDYADTNIVYKMIAKEGLVSQIAKALGIYLA